MTFWYISFAVTKDEGGFRGATVVEATSPENAIAVATMRGLNPGGEAAILAVPREAENEPDFRAMLNRLVGRKEMEAMGARRQGDLPQHIQDQFDDAAWRVCSCCNPPRMH